LRFERWRRPSVNGESAECTLTVALNCEGAADFSDRFLGRIKISPRGRASLEKQQHIPQRSRHLSLTQRCLSYPSGNFPVLRFTA